MNVFVFILLAIFLSVVVPTFIVFHFITRWRQDKTLSGEDERMLVELMQTAERMEQRMDILENILDQDHPRWRQKYKEDLYTNPRPHQGH